MSLDQNYLKSLLYKYNVSGISFAVIRNFELEYAQTVGYSNAEKKTELWTDTIFQGASISKTITSLIIMQMYEEKMLDIDVPINNYIKSWKLPENDWTEECKVTTRHLLCHFGGVNVPTYLGYIKGDETPSLLDVLEGTGPSNSSSVRVEMPVNEKFCYSTGAFAILQLLIEELCENNFEAVAQERVFRPLNMHRTTFSSPLPEDVEKNAASGHRNDGLPVAGDYFIYPEQAGSALWTNPIELAKLAVHLQTILKTRKPGILSVETLEEILTPYQDCSFGLGYALYQDKGEGVFFGHTGNTEGFRSMFIAHKQFGNGAFILVNSDNADPVMKEVINLIAQSQNWIGFSW